MAEKAVVNPDSTNIDSILQEQRKFEVNARLYRDFFVQNEMIQARYLPSLLLVVALVGGFLHGLYLVLQW